MADTVYFDLDDFVVVLQKLLRRAPVTAVRKMHWRNAAIWVLSDNRHAFTPMGDGTFMCVSPERRRLIAEEQALLKTPARRHAAVKELLERLAERGHAVDFAAIAEKAAASANVVAADEEDDDEGERASPIKYIDTDVGDWDKDFASASQAAKRGKGRCL